MATATHRNRLVGIFETTQRAHDGVEALHRAGFTHRQVVMVHHGPVLDGIEVTDLDAAKAAQVSGATNLTKGIVIGAIAGCVVGCVLALILLSVPYLGTTLTSGGLTTSGTIWGVVAALALGIVGGAIGGAIVGAFIGLDFPRREAMQYVRELKSGHALVGVEAGERTPEAWTILQACGGHDLMN